MAGVAPTYHPVEAAEAFAFISRNWIKSEDLNRWLDLLESTNIIYIQERQNMLRSLEALKFKPQLNNQLIINTWVVALHEEPFRSTMTRLKATLNRRQGNTNTTLNRAGVGVVDIVGQNMDQDTNLSLGYMINNMRDWLSNDIYLYDQNRFDTRFDFR